jgi:hypothetical protein
MAITYLPGGQLFFPRSYVRGIIVRCDTPSPTIIDRTIVFWIAGFPPARCEVILSEEFTPWSSNAYSLDHVIDSAKYSYPPDETQFDLPLYAIWNDPLSPYTAFITLDTTYGGDRVPLLLPAAPSGYWLPPFMPL